MWRRSTAAAEFKGANVGQVRAIFRHRCDVITTSFRPTIANVDRTKVRRRPYVSPYIFRSWRTDVTAAVRAGAPQRPASSIRPQNPSHRRGRWPNGILAQCRARVGRRRGRRSRLLSHRAGRSSARLSVRAGNCPVAAERAPDRRLTDGSPPAMVGVPVGDSTRPSTRAISAARCARPTGGASIPRGLHHRVDRSARVRACPEPDLALRPRALGDAPHRGRRRAGAGHHRGPRGR